MELGLVQILRSDLIEADGGVPQMGVTDCLSGVAD
jgi:hypothetical protein